MKRAWIFFLLFFSGLQLMAQEPDNQPTNLQFASIKPYSFDLSFSGSDAQYYLVVRSQAPLSFVPQDGQAYQKGQGVGNGKVFSAGSDLNMTIREVGAGVTYYITVFAYNGTGSNCAYKVNNPLTATVTSAGKQIGNYYSGLNLASATFLADLKYRINTNRIFQDYYDYKWILIPYVLERDTVNNQKVITCNYSGEIKVYDPPFDFVALDYSREHTLPRSWMPTGGSTSTQEGADYHNLILTQQSKANARRLNYPYGKVVNVSYQYLDGKLGTDNSGTTVYEPKESIKGDAARNMFYQMVCYNGLGGSNWGLSSLPSLASQQNLEVLLTWHIQDPVSAEEIARHEYVYTLQNNRNPFIDYPDWVDCINFNNITMQNGCVPTFGTEESEQPVEILAYPNPATDYLFIGNLPQEGVQVSLINMAGQVVLSSTVHPSATAIDVSALKAGIYLLSIQTASGIQNRKIIIQQ